MRIPVLLSELITAIGMTDTRSNQDQPVFITVDDQIVICIDSQPASTDKSETLKLFTYLGSLPENNRESVLLNLLEADFAKHRTGGATLSIEPSSKAVVLMHELVAEGLTLASLKSALEEFTKAALHWKDVLTIIDEQEVITAIESEQDYQPIDIGNFI